MVGHIALPHWVKQYNPEASREETLHPATLSEEILVGLLRKELGFNGLISTDSTPMIGFASAMPRHIAVPKAIASGADMFLFNKDLDEDFHFLLDGIKNGILTEERLDEAVTRILATKASLNLHKDTRVSSDEGLKVVGSEKHTAWADEVASSAITLVRDEQKLLPISPRKESILTSFKRLTIQLIHTS